MLFNTQQHNHQKREGFLVSKLHRIWQKFTLYLVKVFFEDAEIRVWTTLDPEKNLQWHVYNYKTDRTGTFNSEVEAIEWIENSYKHLPNTNKKFWFIPGSSTLTVLNDQ
ncbi:hypothetical protein C7H19_04300 [Aphanothece hegewaldii CCALA 016]|uniref:Uncharacterized protein n=1 Tax=Aphanothece hegewaldii CCALA 016 TaxID=2107694 RepID=A0A2T1M1Z4_9CHRO|nr:hypothetical protein [Aphanothece hegewaldii]PSF38732.1 hypothetical protein C7H19_04300 [Aphanothece hegewaldii CCALA 016]